MGDPKTYTVPEVVEALRKTVQERIDEMADEMVKMRDMELSKSVPGESPVVPYLRAARTATDTANQILVNPAVGVQNGLDRAAAATRRMATAPQNPPVENAHSMDKAETFIDLKHASDPEKRRKTLNKVGKTPSDREIAEFVNKGCGHLFAPKKGKELKKDTMEPKTQAPQQAAPMKTPAPPSQGSGGGPTGVPGVPKPPKAPGSGGATFGKNEFDPKDDPFDGLLTYDMNEFMPKRGPFKRTLTGPTNPPEYQEVDDPGIFSQNPQDFWDDITKSELGTCALCKSPEHSGNC